MLLSRKRYNYKPRFSKSDIESSKPTTLRTTPSRMIMEGYFPESTSYSRLSTGLSRDEQSSAGDWSDAPPARAPRSSLGFLNMCPPRARRTSVPITPIIPITPTTSITPARRSSVPNTPTIPIPHARRYFVRHAPAIPITPTIDFQHIKCWRQACRATHGACCNDDYSEILAEHIKELILVDVNSGSLITVPTSPPITYVALSYVWGNTPMFKTTTNNINVLLQPGTLNNVVLPDTIRDAIRLVKNLGERYLWVDCLSIVQDASPEEKDITLRAMARIYASADLTIVAAGGGDAGHGLRGIGGSSTNRTPDSGSSPRQLGVYPEDSKWATRGWTFQESLFSRRLLIFTDTVSWMCGRCEWEEGINEFTSLRDIYDPEGIKPLRTPDMTWPAERPHLGVPMGMMSLIPTLPSLGRWGMLVENFCSRNLTYESDAQAAFAGATEIMDATFPEGLLHGMPKFFFDIAMLWRPKKSVCRREGEPSWSWTGWKNGTIDCLSAWYPFYAPIFRYIDLELNWLSIATLKPVAKYRIANATDEFSLQFNGFYQYQDHRENPSRILPTGWSRNYHRYGDYFTNTASGQSTKYPFPLPPIDPPERRLHVPSSPVLHCQAPCAQVTFGHVIHGNNTHRGLRNDEETIGNLTMMCEHLDHASQYGSTCELVAISEAETSAFVDVTYGGWPATSFEKSLKRIRKILRHIRGPHKVSVYNVMWIQWVGDVAERRGLGVVRKDLWDALQPEMKEFDLG